MSQAIANEQKIEPIAEPVVGVVRGASLAQRLDEWRWAALGDTLVYWSKDGAPTGSAARLQMRLQMQVGTAPELLRAPYPLYLVGQVGGSFEHEHPEVQVVASKGRYLVVALPPETLHAEEDTHPCWIARPLRDAEVVFSERAPTAAAKIGWIEGLVTRVSEAELLNTITTLANLGTRHSTSPQLITAASWARDALVALGFQVTLRPIQVGGGTSLNVVAERTGSSPNAQVVVLTAHLDSINAAGGASAPAPGADDNASGVAGALEIARVLAALPTFEHDLRVLLFGGEEQGLHGSQQYVASLTLSERSRLRAVINMDMIATLNTAQPTVLLEGAAISQALIDELAAAAATYTSLAVQTSLNPFASDHVPFLQAGIPAVLSIEGADGTNHNVHGPNDTVTFIDTGLAAAIVKMNLAVTAAHLLPLGPSVSSSRATGPIVSWGADRVDAFVVGVDSAAYHKWQVGSAWGPGETDYESLGGTCASPIEAVSWAQNRLDLFVLGTDSQLYHKWWDGSSWGPAISAWEALGGTCSTPPKAVSWAQNRLDLFVLGTDSQLYHKWWDGSSWGPSLTGWEALGGTCLERPEAVAWGPNRLDLFVLGTDHALYHKWWDGSAWGPSLTGFEYMGGTCVGAPQVASWGPDRLDVFVRGTDRALYHKWWDGSAWGPSLTDFEYMGGTCMSDPAVISWGPDRLDVFVIGADHALYHKWWDGSSWGPSLTDFEFMGGTCFAGPFVTSSAPNRLDVFVVGSDGALYQKTWDGSSWSPSLTGWRYLGGVVVPAPVVRQQEERLHADSLRTSP